MAQIAIAKLVRTEILSASLYLLHFTAVNTAVLTAGGQDITSITPDNPVSAMLPLSI